MRRAARGCGRRRKRRRAECSTVTLCPTPVGACMALSSVPGPVLHPKSCGSGERAHDCPLSHPSSRTMDLGSSAIASDAAFLPVLALAGSVGCLPGISTYGPEAWRREGGCDLVMIGTLSAMLLRGEQTRMELHRLQCWISFKGRRRTRQTMGGRWRRRGRRSRDGRSRRDRNHPGPERRGRRGRGPRRRVGRRQPSRSGSRPPPGSEASFS